MALDRKEEGVISEAVFKPLEKKRSSDQIAALIQHKILRGHLEIGTDLPSKKEPFRSGCKAR
jgi:hypothetical protein